MGYSPRREILASSEERILLISRAGKGVDRGYGSASVGWSNFNCDYKGLIHGHTGEEGGGRKVAPIVNYTGRDPVKREGGGLWGKAQTVEDLFVSTLDL